MNKDEAIRLMKQYAAFLKYLYGYERLQDTKMLKKRLHLVEMPDRVTEDFSLDKTMRWLGFMQGAFWAMHYFKLEDLKKHSKTLEVKLANGKPIPPGFL